MQTNTILIIEDDQGLIELLREKAEGCGYQTVCVQSAAKALDWLKENTPLMMILDYSLPDMNGKEFLAELRTKEQPLPPFIISTGQGDERVAVEMMKLGARDYIIKDSTFLDMIPLVVSQVGKEIENENKLRQAEEALRESDDIIRVNIENSFDVIFTLNNEGIFVFVSRAWERHFGYPVNDVIGKPFALFVHPDDVAPCVEYLMKVLNTGKSGTSPAFRVRHSDGTWRWFIANGTPFVNQKGEHQLIGVGHDITERKQAEDVLHNSEAIHSSMISNISDVIGIIGLDGIMKYKSPSIEKWFGWQPQDLVGTDGWLTVHPDDLERIQKEFFTLLEKDNSVKTVEYRYKCKNGSYKPIKLTATNLTNDPIIGGVLLNYHDITGRKRAEEALQNERLLLRSIIDNIPDSIYVKDLTCRKTLANLAEVRYMGVKSESEALGKDDFGVYPNELAQKFFTDDQAVMKTGKPMLNREEYILDEKKQKRYLRSSKIPLRDKDGQIIGLVGISHDITERKQAELEIKLKNEELSKLNSEKDRFFSIIAHDLRAPFNGFLGLTHMLVDELDVFTLKEIQKIAVNMRNSATNLFRLLENLLDWSRMEQGLIPFDPENVLLLPIVNESLTVALGLAKNKGIELTSNIPHNLDVFVDGNMFKTVIRNIVSNAIKFTPKGGRITIAAKSLHGNSVEISVKDTGIGMSKNMIENLFSFNKQTGRKGTEGEPSTGLGLIICKDFIERHGAKIWAESEEGKGTTFFIELQKNEFSE